MTTFIPTPPAQILPPGSALEVAKHFIACILTQFGDRRLFLYLFGHDLGAQADIVFHAIAKSLPEHESESEGGRKWWWEGG